MEAKFMKGGEKALSLNTGRDLLSRQHYLGRLSIGVT
jgi:hypothetical protein